jgi:glycosyltransferase involved in cell wall biosynthesis
MKTPVLGYAGSKLHNWGEAPPKVLMVAEATGGGSGRHVAELAEGLLKAGCRVHLLYSDLRAEQAFRDAIGSLNGLRAQQIPMRREPHWSDMAFLWQIRRYMNKIGGFDIVHAHSSKAGVLARLAAFGTGAVKIYTPHAMRTMDPALHPAVREFYRAVEVGLARTSCEAVIAVSEYERQHVVAQGVPAAKTHMVINGIPPVRLNDRPAIRAALGIVPDEVAIGFIGRLVPQKAPGRFVAAVAAVARHHPRVRGILVGSGPLRDSVHKAARDAGIFERIVWVTDRQGPHVLPAFDMLLMPSLYEGMPYVLLEALAVGVPVVATDVGGVAEAIEDRVTGFVVPQQDAAALLEKVQLLVEHADLRQAMAEASLRKSGEMSVEHMVEQTLQVYRAALRLRYARNGHLPVGLDARRQVDPRYEPMPPSRADAEHVR